MHHNKSLSLHKGKLKYRVKWRQSLKHFPTKKGKEKGFKKNQQHKVHIYLVVYKCVYQDKTFMHPTFAIGDVQWFSSNKLCFSFCQKCQESFGHKNVFFFLKCEFC
jgi:hypothetical protein